MSVTVDQARSAKSGYGKDDLCPIVIEGAIGVGKSTLCDEISEIVLNHQQFDVVQERVEQTLLNEFYKNPVANAYWFQTYMFTQRIVDFGNRVKENTREYLDTHKFRPIRYVFDRSIFGDMVFAVTNYICGNINDMQLSLYMTCWRACMESLNPDNVYNDSRIIFLNVTLEETRKRILKRGNEAEKDISAAYLNILICVYYNLVMSLLEDGRQVVIVNNVSAETPLNVRGLITGTTNGNYLLPQLSMIANIIDVDESEVEEEEGEEYTVADLEETSDMYERMRKVLRFYIENADDAYQILSQLSLRTAPKVKRFPRVQSWFPPARARYCFFEKKD